MEVIILAGGLATRLRSTVGDTPKCLAPVAGEPFLNYLMPILERAGASRVILAVGHLREQVEAWASSRSFPFDVVFSVEDSPLGTGGAIRRALELATSETVTVLNGDTVFNCLGEMPKSLPEACDGLVMLRRVPDCSRYGTVALENGRILKFEEKKDSGEGLVSGGVYLIRRDALKDFPEKFSFETDFLRPAAERGKLCGKVADGYFIDIGIPSDYARAQQELPELSRLLKASDAIMESSADTLFLDRDGVINRKIDGDYVRRPEQFVFLPGILESLRLWAGKFQRIIIVTNQRGVGRGLMSLQDLNEVHDYMLAGIKSAGGRIDKVYTATSADEADPMRKPSRGMFDAALCDFPSICQAIMAGDAPSDAAFAANCGIPFIQV